MCTSISLCFYTIVVLFSKKKERKCHDAINNVYDITRTVINQSDHDFVICILTTIGGKSRPEKKVNIRGRNVTWNHSNKNIHGQVDMLP